MPLCELGRIGARWTVDSDFKLIEAISEIDPNNYPLKGKENQLKQYLESVYLNGLKKVDVSSELGWPTPDAYVTSKKILKYAKITTRSKGSLVQEIKRLFGQKDFPKRSISTTTSLKDPDPIPVVNHVGNIKVFTSQLYRRLPKKYLYEISPTSHLFLKYGQIGLEWLNQGSSALYVYPDVNEVDFARMFLDILRYIKQEGKTLDSYLNKRVNQRNKKMYDVFQDQPLIPLDNTLLIPHRNSPVTVLTSLFLVELAALLEGLTKMHFPTLPSYKSILYKTNGVIAQVNDLQKKGILKKDSAIDALQNSLAAVSDYCIPRDNNDKPVITQEDLNNLDGTISTIDGMLAGLTKVPIEFPPFYIQTSTLFELYAFVYLSSLSQGQYDLIYQKSFKAITPDISVYDQNGKLQFLIDAKWKKKYSNNSKVSKQDCDQVEKFRDRSGASKVFLTYPTKQLTPIHSFDEYLKPDKVVSNSSEKPLTVPLGLPPLQ